MSLESDVRKALADAGKQLKDDLWSPSDKQVLLQRAKDLVGLEQKAATTTDEAKAAQYRLAGELVVQHVQLLALARMNVAEKHVVEALGRFFMNVLLPRLIELLPHLFGV